jgi:diguanylate cyclase (GGDEF)-like protein
MERNLRLDALTGALNRETLLAQIRFRQRAATEFLPLQYALLFLDLDRFKPINDEYGHDTGDRALIEITARLTSSLRAHDEVARFGGDEFVVYLHDVSSEDNLQAIRSKIAALLDAPLALREDLSVSIGASIGWAIYPIDGADVDTILRVADGRMFEIKKARKQP